MVPGEAGQLLNATCTPRGELFFELYQQGDPLEVRGKGDEPLGMCHVDLEGIR
jgi:hypothetical protein